MVLREFSITDENKLNKFLEQTNYQITKNTFTDNPYRHYLLIEDRDIIGTLVFDEIYERFEIIYIYISPKERRRGYAYNLMCFLIEKVRQKNGKNITLEVDINNSKAIKLYKKCGFEIVSVRKNYYDDHDGYLMMRKM